MIVCTFKWSKPGYRSKYGPENVNTLASMVRRNYVGDLDFVCITDDPDGISPEIRIVPLWDEFRNLKNPSFSNGPNCYPRLKMFDASMADIIGPRFACFDLDVVITRNLNPILDRKDDFLIWGDTVPGYWYNGSFWMMDAGARHQVYSQFDPVKSPRVSHAAGRRGSDQGWIAHCLGPHENTVSRRDGVFSFNNHIQRLYKGNLPLTARIVVFHGLHDPWHPEIQQRYQWVKEHYR